VRFKYCKQLLEYNIYFYLETSGGGSYDLHLMFIFSIPVLVRYLWQLKTFVFMHWYIISAVLLVNLKKSTYLKCQLEPFRHFVLGLTFGNLTFGRLTIYPNTRSIFGQLTFWRLTISLSIGTDT
jgi:hypothetical protein